MKSTSTIFFLLFFFVFNYVAISQTESFTYISPVANSTLNSLGTNIILRSPDFIDNTSLSSEEFSIIGSLSGNHSGTVKLSDDNKTVLFLPNAKFFPNEEVNVIVNPGIKTINGKEFSRVSFQFKTTPLTQNISLNPYSFIGDGSFNNIKKLSKFTTIHATMDTLPADFPSIIVDSTNNPSDGKIFLSVDTINFASGDSIGNYLVILNNNGNVLKYKKTKDAPLDFKVQPNGELSYADITIPPNGFWLTKWIVMDTTLAVVDTFQCGNGYYSADTHDFLLLPNGHALLFATDPETVDMSQYGGDTNATVVGNVIQELDASKNVVFEWRSWDHIPDTASYVSLTQSTVDLIHGNSLEVDNNGNIIFSMRHLSSIIKIDRQTGNTDWILGGKENQFTFVNENQSNSPDYFSYQHDARLLPNGDLTLFDNGNQHSPQYSRAVEYQLDEQNKTATMVWEYRHNPDIYNMAMGSVQRLPNGNTIIGWGFAGFTGSPALTEVHSDNSVALEMFLPPNQGSYRVYKFPWVSQTPEASISLSGFIQGNTYEFDNATDTTGIKITFSQLNSSLYATATVSKYNYAPLNPTFNGMDPIFAPTYFAISGQGITSYTATVTVNLNYYPSVSDSSNLEIYERNAPDSNFVPLATNYDSQTNELTFVTSIFGDFAFGKAYVTGIENSKNSPLTYKLNQNYPNPFNPSTIINFEIPKSGFVSLKIYDILGRQVATLVNEQKSAGSYNINFNASTLSSGIYFYSLKAGNFFQVKKMILLK